MTDPITLTETVLRLVGELRGDTAAPVAEDSTLDELGLDSLDRIALAVAVETTVGIPVPDEVLASLRTVADLLRHVVPLSVDNRQLSEVGTTAAADRAAPPTTVATVDGAVLVHPSAEVGAGAVLGAGTRLWHQAQVSPGVTIGAGCTLGKGAYLGVGAVLGDQVKVGNHAGVFGAQVADRVMICPGALLLEDPTPRATNPSGQRQGPTDWTGHPVTVETGATIGAGAMIAPGVHIGAHAMVALGAVVSRDVPDHALVAGNPARRCGWVCVCGHRLDDHHRCPTCARTYTPNGPGLALEARHG